MIYVFFLENTSLKVHPICSRKMNSSSESGSENEAEVTTPKTVNKRPMDDANDASTSTQGIVLIYNL